MTTRRERSGNTYNEIIKVATELFRSQGFNGTGVAQIASTVGITNAALYYYFSSKQELLLRVLESGISGQFEILQAIAQSPASATTRLERAIDNHLDLLFGRPEAVRVFLRERRFLDEYLSHDYLARVKGYDMLFDQILEDGLQSSEFEFSDTRLMRLAILGMLNWVTEWYDVEGPLTEIEIRQTLTGWIMGRLVVNGSRLRSDQMSRQRPD